MPLCRCTLARLLGRMLGGCLLPAAALAMVGLFPAAARAEYPKRTITLIVPFAPGDSSDFIARILAAELSQSLRQPVVVDNRPGAAGNIGMAAAARATPDGYTLLLTSSAIAVNAALFRNPPFDPINDFSPIAELADTPDVVVVRPDSGIATLGDLIAQAKAAPERFNYAGLAAGTRSHLTGELIKLGAGIKMVHVPFRTSGGALSAVLAGTVQVATLALRHAAPLIRSGKLHALAVTGAKRWPSLSNIPTVSESGVPNFVSETFHALFAPAGTSRDVVGLLAFESHRIFEDPKVREQARRAGYEVVAGSPEQLAAHVKAEIAAMRDLVDRTGMMIP